MSSLTPYHWRRRIAMRDVDAFGVVWYGNYLGLCDEARAELLRAFGIAPGKLMELGFIAPVVEIEGRYHMPARHDEEIDVHVRIPSARGSRLVFEFTIKRSHDQQLIARIATTMVLLRTNGDLVYFPPEPLKTPLERLVSEQPKEAP